MCFWNRFLLLDQVLGPLIIWYEIITIPQFQHEMASVSGLHCFAPLSHPFLSHFILSAQVRFRNTCKFYFLHFPLSKFHFPSVTRNTPDFWSFIVCTSILFHTKAHKWDCQPYTSAFCDIIFKVFNVYISF